MSDESQELRRINWTECFAFTQIFRTFRLAIQPNKLALAAIGLVATCLVGWVLDAIWCATDTYALPREIAAFVRPGNLDDWRTGQIAGGKMTVQKILAAGTVVQKDREIKDDKTYWKLVDELPDDIRDHYVETLDAIDGTDKVEELQALCAKMTLPGELPVLLSGKTADELKAIARTRAYEAHADALAQLNALAPQGIFQSFRRCCATAFLDMVSAATRLDVFGGMNQVLGVGDAAPRIAGLGGERPGVLPSLCMILHGVKWLVVEHWLYALVWGLLVLAIWSLAGGAICRIAAVQAARDEKIGLTEAFRFARQKFVGFFTAPVIPVAMIVAGGVVLAIGGLIGAIPYLGEIVLVLGLGLALLGGFVMTLVTVGAGAGGSLMWPTIAVEGSDSFDALSRSFSYVYSRPWRTLFYYLVAIVYGSLCYLFVRFFLVLMLKLTHVCVRLGMWWTDRPDAGPGMKKLDVIWQNVSFTSLAPTGAVLGGSGLEDTWVALVARGWVWLAVVFSFAFVLSFYFSGSTIIYYLLRRKVDATDMDDVYLDEPEDEEPFEPATPEPTAVAPAPLTPPAPTPARPAEPAPPSESPRPTDADGGGTPPPDDSTESSS